MLFFYPLITNYPPNKYEKNVNLDSVMDMISFFLRLRELRRINMLIYPSTQPLAGAIMNF